MAVLLALAYLPYNSFILYAKALCLMRIGDYPTATVIFEGLDDYVNSKDLSNRCRYDAGFQAMKKGKYRQASDYFEHISQGVSQRKMAEAYYRLGGSYEQEGWYYQAALAYTRALRQRGVYEGGTKDQSDLSNEEKADWQERVDFCWYEAGLQEENDNQLVSAIDCFFHCTGYKDSRDRLQRLEDTLVKQYLDDNEPHKIYSIFVRFGYSPDNNAVLFSEVKKKLQLLAKEYFYANKLKDVCNLYEMFGNYLDDKAYYTEAQYRMQYSGMRR